MNTPCQIVSRHAIECLPRSPYGHTSGPVWSSGESCNNASIVDECVFRDLSKVNALKLGVRCRE